jgi:hypothetical protein
MSNSFGLPMWEQGSSSLPEVSVESQGLPFLKEPTPIFAQRAVERCHVVLPDTPRPTSAIYFEGRYYAYVKLFPNTEVARHKAALMTQRGDLVILTRVPKGLVLWVFEPDAQPIHKISQSRTID